MSVAVFDRVASEEEQLVWADIQLELQDALQEDINAENAKIEEFRKRKNEEAVTLQLSLNDADSELDDFIIKVNKQADSIDHLKRVLDASRQRCIEDVEVNAQKFLAEAALNDRAIDLRCESEQIELLISECSSLSISDVNDDEIKKIEEVCVDLFEAFSRELHAIKATVQCKLTSLKEMQESYEGLKGLRKQRKKEADEKKIRKEKIEQIQAHLMELTDAVQLLDEKLDLIAKEEEKNSLEIEAAKSYVEKLEEEVDELQEKHEKVVSDQADIVRKIEEVERQCRETEAFLSSLPDKYISLEKEQSGWSKLYLQLQWGKKQKLQEKVKEQQEMQSKPDKWETPNNACQQVIKSDAEETKDNAALAKTNVSVDKCLNETNATIVFDPVQLVSSTPIVSPRLGLKNLADVVQRHGLRDLGVKSKPSVSVNPKTASSNQKGNNKRQKKRSVQPRSRPAKKPIAKKSRRTQHDGDDKCGRDMYDMLDSE